MARFEEHCEDCERLIGERCEPVNIWMDELFSTLGAVHRSGRHHTDGIRRAQNMFGYEGGQAATIHILKDCGFIPTVRDWKTGVVDPLGMKINGSFRGIWDPARFDAEAKKLLALYDKLNS